MLIFFGSLFKTYLLDIRRAIRSPLVLIIVILYVYKLKEVHVCLYNVQRTQSGKAGNRHSDTV